MVHVTGVGCGVIVELGDDRVEILLEVSGGGGEFWVIRRRAAILLEDLAGIEINVPSGLKNWSMCSVMMKL